MSIQLHRKKWIVGASIVAWLVILMCSVGFASYQALAEPVVVDNAPIQQEEVQRGGITIEKRDFDTGKLTPQGNASIEGTEFSVCLKDDGVQNQVLVNDKLYSRGEEVVHLTIGADGTASTAANALPYGTYTIQEVKAAEGYFLTDGEVRTFSIHEEGFVQPYTNAGDGAFINKVYRGDVQIVKHDLDSDTTTPQGEASLAGIKFAIKNTSKWPVQVDGVEYATGETVKIITTGEDGIAKTEGWTDAGGVKRGTLPYGTYTIEELPWDDAHPDYANASYMWTDKTVYDFKIEKDGITVVQDYKVNTDMIYRNMVVRGGVSVEKRDIETKASCALGGATLEGTKFQIWLSEDVEQNPVYVNGKWYKKGEIIDLLAGDATYDVDGAHDLYPSAGVKATLITDEDGKVETSADALPYGTYTIKEVAASTGYLLTDGEPRTFSVRVDGYIKPYKQQGENGADAAWYNQVKRANMSFSKKLQGTSNKGAWIPFLLTSKSTGETHVVVTDENGYFDTEKYPHSTSTNSMDALIKEATSTDEYTFEYNGKKYTYNKSYLREATDADDFKFEISGKKYTLDEKKIQLAAAEYGVWFGWDVDGNVAPVNDKLCALPYDTELFQNGGYTLQELPCANNYGYELITSDINVRQDKQVIDYGTLDDEEKPTIIISKEDATTGKEVEGATLLLEKLTDTGDWEKIDEWVSVKEAHKVENQTIGKYRLTETMTPKTYEKAEVVEFEVIKGEDVKQVVMYDKPIEITGDIDKRQNAIYEVGDDGSYIYTVDYRSTSNTWADEMNMWDTIDCAVAGYSYLQYVNTPVIYGDNDGLMNVWYKTNKTEATDASDSSKYNACSTNPANPHNPNNERVHDYTGWKLWKADVSTLKSETLKVADLSLADGEYVIGVAFEHGRVEVGAGSAASDSKQWTRDALKNEADFIDEESDNFMKKTVNEDGTITVTHMDTFTDAEGNEVTYQPAVFGMLPTEEALADETIEYWNSADMDIHRNLAPDEKKLNDKDNDKVVQKTSLIWLSKIDATTSKEVEGATLILEAQNKDGSWRKIDEWVSTTEVHKHGGKIGTKYRLTEILAPKTYLVADPIEFVFNGSGAENVVVMKDEPIEITGDIDKRENAFYEIDDEGAYIYTVDYRSTSNTWADEMNMWDTIDCAVEEKAFFEYLNTPVFFGDYDGKMNVWYKTNKTDETYADDAEKYNACSTNPANPHNPNNERVHDYTGWKLWKADVSTLKSETLKVADLSLADGEYVIGVAFEHGRVEVGAGTQAQDSNQWTRDTLKNNSDIIGEENDAYVVREVDAQGITTVKHTKTFKDAEGNEVTYQPVVIGMRATQEVLEAGGVEIWNSADMDIHRNLAPSEKKLNDDDEDKVKLITPKISTTATDKEDGDKEVAIGENIVIVDVVEYENLEVGKEYTMNGVLHVVNKFGIEEKVLDDSENTVTFTPMAKNGKVEVELEVNTKDLQGKSLVAFEKCNLKDVTVAKHEDLSDEGQTVVVSTNQPTAFDEDAANQNLPKTGDKAMIGFAILLLIACGALASAMYLKVRKQGKAEKKVEVSEDKKE